MSRGSIINGVYSTSKNNISSGTVFYTETSDTDFIIYPIISTTMYNCDINLIIDTASDITLCSNQVPKILKLRKHKCCENFQISALNGENVANISEYVILPLEKGNVEIKCFIINEISNSVKSNCLTRSLQEHIRNLQLSPTQRFDGESIQIDILIGLDQIGKILINGFFRVLTPEIISLPTIYGDCLLGIKNSMSSIPSFNVKNAYL